MSGTENTEKVELVNNSNSNSSSKKYTHYSLQVPHCSKILSDIGKKCTLLSAFICIIDVMINEFESAYIALLMPRIYFVKKKNKKTK